VSSARPATRQRRVSLAGLLLSLALLAAGLYLMFSAYRRVSAPLRLTGQGVPAQGVVTEKFVDERPDRLLPFDVTTYVVRYAYPNAEGQMRTGEQIVTRKTYEGLPGQGGQAFVLFDPAEPGLSAIDSRLTFPGGAGWRAGLAAAALAGMIVFSTISTALSQHARSAA
jgi:hypothetical protein